MQKKDLSGFPALIEDFDALHDEINRALKRTWLLVGAVILPCSGLVVYALGMAAR